jgi:hypothetical protein
MSAQGAPRAQPPEYPVQHSAIVNPRNTANLRREQRLDHRPLEICQIETRHCQSSILGKLNQKSHRLGILFMGM